MNLPRPEKIDSISSPIFDFEVFATALHDLDIEFTPWQKLPPVWQQQLQAATIAQPPSYLVSPRTVETLTKIVRACDRAELPILLCGRGSKLSWGKRLPQTVTLALSSQYLNRLLDWAVGDLTVTVEAGIKLADLQATLARENQFLPLYPLAPDSTIGGLVATADSWRHRYGGVRDTLLGLSFVRADGAMAKAGGRVVKNVAGYDLMKLFAGSYGSLGLITQVTLRTYPQPPDSATVVLTGTSDAIAKTALALTSSSLAPTHADLLSRAAATALGVGEGLAIVARFQSIAESVSEQCRQLEAIGKEFNLSGQRYYQEAEDRLWQQLRESFRHPASPAAATGKIGLAPTDAVKFCDRAEELCPERALAAIHLGIGLGRFHIEGENLPIALQQLRQICQEHRGFLTILEAPGAIETELEPWGYTGNATFLMKKIKQKFDSKNIFNPGKMF